MSTLMRDGVPSGLLELSVPHSLVVPHSSLQEAGNLIGSCWLELEHHQCIPIKLNMLVSSGSRCAVGYCTRRDPFPTCRRSHPRAGYCGRTLWYEGQSGGQGWGLRVRAPVLALQEPIQPQSPAPRSACFAATPAMCCHPTVYTSVRCSALVNRTVLRMCTLYGERHNPACRANRPSYHHSVFGPRLAIAQIVVMMDAHECVS